jgi:nitrogen PTS system EIIA component
MKPIMGLGNILTEDRIVAELHALSPWEVIDELLDKLTETGAIKRVHREVVLAAIRKREQSMSTGIGFGLAIPHATTDVIKDAIAAFGRSKTGIDFDALDGQPVRLITLFLVPEGQFQRHLHTLASIAKVLHDAECRRSLEHAPDAPAMFRIIQQQEARTLHPL